MKKKILLFFLFILILAAFSEAPAAEKIRSTKEKTAATSSPIFYTDQKETLRGLKNLSVFVEPLSPDLEKAGITADQLREEIEARLTKAGITVLREDEEGNKPQEPGRTTLYINFIPYTLQKDLTYGFSLNVYFNQRVILHHNPKISCLATTWYSGGVGIIRANKLKHFGQVELAEHIDKFINNFLAVNPK